MATTVPVIQPDGAGAIQATANALTMAVYSGSDATTEYSVKASPYTLIILRRASGTTRAEVTLVTPFEKDGLALPDKVYPIATSTRALIRIGRLAEKYYADTNGDYIFRLTTGNANEVEISASDMIS